MYGEVDTGNSKFSYDQELIKELSIKNMLTIYENSELMSIIRQNDPQIDLKMQEALSKYLIHSVNRMQSDMKKYEENNDFQERWKL